MLIQLVALQFNWCCVLLPSAGDSAHYDVQNQGLKFTIVSQQCPHSCMAAQWPQLTRNDKRGHRISSFIFVNKHSEDCIYLHSLINLTTFSEGSTCLQCLHLFQWIHLQPQPLKLGLHIIFLCSCISMKRQEKDTSQVNMGGKHSAYELCWMCIVTSGLARWNGLPGAGWTARAEVKQAEAKKKEDREGQTCHVWRQWILQDRTQWRTLCCWERNQKHWRQLNIYWPSVYPFLGSLPALAPTLFVFVHTSGRGERGKRVEWQKMKTLCLAFDKYLLGTSCTKQYSLSFHKQTGNSLTASLLQSVLHTMPRQVKNNVMPWCQVRKKCQNVWSVKWYHPNMKQDSYTLSGINKDLICNFRCMKKIKQLGWILLLHQHCGYLVNVLVSQTSICIIFKNKAALRTEEVQLPALVIFRMRCCIKMGGEG